MLFRKLGNTDIDVSLICLGTMTWGEQNTEAEAHAQLDYALTQGVNFIDTAEMYPIPPKGATQGLTETYIGNWLHQRGKRDDLVLATKVAGPGELMAHVRGGPRLNRTHIEQAIDASLQRLRTDYVDLYQVHWPRPDVAIAGTLERREDVIEGLAVGLHQPHLVVPSPPSTTSFPAPPDSRSLPPKPEMKSSFGLVPP